MESDGDVEWEGGHLENGGWGNIGMENYEDERMQDMEHDILED